MFGSVDNVDVLAEALHIMLDCTFSSAPQHFTQLMSTHGLFDSGWHMQLVYGLLPGKTDLFFMVCLFGIDIITLYLSEIRL